MVTPIHLTYIVEMNLMKTGIKVLVRIRHRVCWGCQSRICFDKTVDSRTINAFYLNKIQIDHIFFKTAINQRKKERDLITSQFLKSLT